MLNVSKMMVQLIILQMYQNQMMMVLPKMILVEMNL
jgi:hypothetical protein